MKSVNYFKAEVLKHKHSSVSRLTILMPLISVLMSAVLTHVYFAVDGYNWWYSLLAPGFTGLLCGIVSEKDKKLGNRAIWSLPCDMKRVWDAKVLYGIAVSGAATVFLTGMVMIISYLLETQLHVNFLIRPSFPAQLAAGTLIWLSFCWQIPWCLFLAQMIGRIPMIILHFAGYSMSAFFMSLSPVYMLFPGAITSRMMCVILKVMPNGLPAKVGEMSYTPRLLDPSSIPIGIAASIVWLALLWLLTRLWYNRKVEKA